MILQKTQSSWNGFAVASFQVPVVAVFQGGYRGFGNDLPYPPNW